MSNNDTNRLQTRIGGQVTVGDGLDTVSRGTRTEPAPNSDDVAGKHTRRAKRAGVVGPTESPEIASEGQSRRDWRANLPSGNNGFAEKVRGREELDFNDDGRGGRGGL